MSSRSAQKQIKSTTFLLPTYAVDRRCTPQLTASIILPDSVFHLIDDNTPTHTQPRNNLDSSFSQHIFCKKNHRFSVRQFHSCSFSVLQLVSDVTNEHARTYYYLSDDCTTQRTYIGRDRVARRPDGRAAGKRNYPYQVRYGSLYNGESGS